MHLLWSLQWPLVLRFLEMASCSLFFSPYGTGRSSVYHCIRGNAIYLFMVCSNDLCNFPGGLPCKLEGILESPIVDGYRNKCEFSVGYSLEGKKTVGFMLGNFRLAYFFTFFFTALNSSNNDWYNMILGKAWLLLRNLWTAQMSQKFPVNMLRSSKIFCSHQACLCGAELIIVGFGANSQYALSTFKSSVWCFCFIINTLHWDFIRFVREGIQRKLLFYRMRNQKYQKSCLLCRLFGAKMHL